MNPMVLLLLGGAGFLLYNYFQEPTVPVGSEPIPTGPVTVQAQATPPTTLSQVETAAEKLEAFAGGNFNHGGNFWEWDYYNQKLTGRAAPHQDYPLFTGMTTEQIKATPITAAQFLVMTGNSGLGMIWSTPGRYLSLSDRGLGGNGPSGFERLSTTYRRIN